VQSQDDKTLSVTNIVKNSPVSLDKQWTMDNVTDSVREPKNGLKSDLTTVIVTDKTTKRGMCEFCGADFEKKVSWKRFCCDDCRIAAWEQKNGKLKIKAAIK
jgi:hypothetical protein